MIIVKDYTVKSMIEGLAANMGEADFDIVQIAICGHMQRHTQKQLMADLISRGIIGTEEDEKAEKAAFS